MGVAFIEPKDVSSADAGNIEFLDGHVDGPRYLQELKETARKMEDTNPSYYARVMSRLSSEHEKEMVEDFLEIISGERGVCPGFWFRVVLVHTTIQRGCSVTNIMDEIELLGTIEGALRNYDIADAAVI